jgi:hypothetical protein
MKNDLKVSELREKDLFSQNVFTYVCLIYFFIFWSNDNNNTNHIQNGNHAVWFIHVSEDTQLLLPACLMTIQ